MEVVSIFLRNVGILSDIHGRDHAHNILILTLFMRFLNKVTMAVPREDNDGHFRSITNISCHSPI